MIEGLQKIDPDYEERMLQFEMDCDKGKGDAWACHSVGEFLAVVKASRVTSSQGEGLWDVGSGDLIQSKSAYIPRTAAAAPSIFFLHHHTLSSTGRLQQGGESLLGELRQVLAPPLLLQPGAALPYVTCARAGLHAQSFSFFCPLLLCFYTWKPERQSHTCGSRMCVCIYGLDHPFIHPSIHSSIHDSLGTHPTVGGRGVPQSDVKSLNCFGTYSSIITQCFCSDMDRLISRSSRHI